MRKERIVSNGQVETKKRDGEECFDEAPLDGEETEDEGHKEGGLPVPRNGSLEWPKEDVPSDVEVRRTTSVPRDGCTNDVKYFEDASSDEEDNNVSVSREDSTNDDEYSEEVVSFEENPRAEEDDLASRSLNTAKTAGCPDSPTCLPSR